MVGHQSGSTDFDTHDVLSSTYQYLSLINSPVMTFLEFYGIKELFDFLTIPYVFAILTIDDAFNIILPLA
jgi:hypothetical protein